MKQKKKIKKLNWKTQHALDALSSDYPEVTIPKVTWRKIILNWLLN